MIIICRPTKALFSSDIPEQYEVGYADFDDTGNIVLHFTGEIPLGAEVFVERHSCLRSRCQTAGEMVICTNCGGTR